MKPIALITGASGGIGYEFARVMAREGFDLVLVARSMQKMQELSKQLEIDHQTKSYLFEADLSSLEMVNRLINFITEKQITIDVLVNNAGFGEFGLFTETRLEKEIQMITLNISALTVLTKFFARDMVRRKQGRILNVASTAAFLPGPLMSVYYATKAYVLSFSEALANELNGSGVTMTVLCPGPTASGFQSSADINDSRLVKGRKLPTSKEVAEYGYQQMMRGKTLAIPGLINKLQVFAGRFMPRSIVPALVRKASEKV